MAQRSTELEGFLHRHRWWLILIALVIGVIGLAAFMSARRSVVPVRATDVSRGTITSSIDTNGKVEPLNNFEAHAPAPSTVRQILVTEGQRVKAGQLLLVLDDAEARAQAAKAQAQMRAAEADLQAVRTGGTREEVLTTQSQLAQARTTRDAAARNLQALQRLEQQGAASPAEVQAAANQLKAADSNLNLLQQKLTSRYSTPEVARVQAQMTEAKASYAAAEDLLSHSEIRAPRQGVVYSLPVHQGNFVNSGELLVQVADLAQVQVVGYVDEPDIGRLKIGEKVNVTWDALPGRSWAGTVTQTPTTVTARGTRTVGEITCIINNQDMKLLPNVNVSVRIVTGEDANALILPREAVHLEGDGRRYVYEIVRSELKKRYIETSLSNLTSVAVTSGLPDGARVAVASQNASPLRDGLPVRVVQK